MEYWLTYLGTYPLKDEVGIGVACVTLRMYLRERDICWEHTVRHNEERTDSVGEFIWSWGFGIGGHHLLQVWEKVYGNCVPYKGTLVWKVYARITTSDGSN